MNNNIFDKKCIYVIIILFLITCGFVWVSHSYKQKSEKLLEEVEYYDSLNRYNKLYYSKTFKELKKENKQLYDSLKKYKDKIDYIVQFSHEKEYNTGKIENAKPQIKDSTKNSDNEITIPDVAKTYEYTSEPNDTFQYKLNINSVTKPNWYSLNVKTKNKFTIVNKEDGNGNNHITIGPNNGGNISDVTVYKKKKSFWKRFVVGPSVTAGYDPINHNFGVMVGFGVTYNLNNK